MIDSGGNGTKEARTERKEGTRTKLGSLSGHLESCGGGGGWPEEEKGRKVCDRRVIRPLKTKLATLDTAAGGGEGLTRSPNES